MKQSSLKKMWLTAGFTVLAGVAPSMATASGLLSQKAPENPYGSGLYAYSILNNLEEAGLYSLSYNGENTMAWASPFTDSYLFNGWFNEGRICGLNMALSDGTPVLFRYNEYDFETGEVLASRTLDETNLMNYFKFCTYIPEKNQVFGVGVDEKNWTCVKYMNMDNFLDSEEDPEIVIVKNINYSQYILSICYNPIDKNVYAIDEYNTMVRINQETGDYESLITIPGTLLSEGRPQGLIYLPNKDEYLLAGIWKNEYSTHLYRIDLTEQKVIEVNRIENDPYITFFVNTQEVDGLVPTRPEYVSMSFPEGALTGELTYTMPKTLANGEAAPQNMEWRLLIDGEETAVGTGAAGETVVANATMTQGTHALEMMAFYDGHEGFSAKNDIYVGNDVPKAPANVVLVEGKVSWDPVTEGVNGGYINLDDLVYEVYVNDEFIGETEETEITFTISDDDSFSRHIAEVRAISNDLESEAGFSQPALYGKPMKLDVHFDCNTRDDAAFFSSSNDGDSCPAWGFSDYQGAFATSKGYKAGEAWLVTPPINFEDADALYSLVFDLKEETEWGESPVFSTYLVSPDDQKTPVVTICGSYNLPESFKWGTVEKNFKVPAAGVYCVAFVSKQEAEGNTSMMRNLNICYSSMAGNAPDVPEEFTAVAAEGGALKAIVNFNMPTKDVSGEEIPSDAEITAVLKCGEATATATGAPASAQSVEIETLQGNNEITASFAIGEAVGMSCKTSVFTGKDVPSAPLNVTVSLAADNRTATFKWEAPTTGANGHYFDTEGLRYTVRNKAGWSWTDIAVVEDGATEITCELPEYEQLTLLYISIAASNEIGDGGNTMVPVCVGKPYALPMNEQFKDVAYYTYSPVYLETPTDEYAGALIYFVPPYQLNGPFEDKTEHSSIAAFPGVYGESRSRVVLPKFSTKSDDANTVKLMFEMYAGEVMAEDVTIYARTYDMEEPVALGKVEPTGGWTTVEFNLPEEFMDKEWVNLFVDSRHPQDGTFMIIYGYNFDFSTGVDGIVDGEGTISASGRYIYFNNLDNESYSIYSLDGKLVKSGVIDSTQLAVGLNPGVYVAKAGLKTVKVILK